jgi:hypothetical protein
LSRLISGENMRLKNSKRPIMKPSGMPTSAARPKPMATRCSEQDVPADALVVGALAVERVGEQLHRRVEGLARRGEAAAVHRQQRPDADQQGHAQHRWQHPHRQLAPVEGLARRLGGPLGRCGRGRRRCTRRGLGGGTGLGGGRGGLERGMEDGTDHGGLLHAVAGRAGLRP